MTEWVAILATFCITLILNAFVTVFIAGRVVGKLTSAVDAIVDRINRTDAQNTSTLENINREQDQQWSKIGELRDEVSFLKGRAAGGRVDQSSRRSDRGAARRNDPDGERQLRSERDFQPIEYQHRAFDGQSRQQRRRDHYRSPLH